MSFTTSSHLGGAGERLVMMARRRARSFSGAQEGMANREVFVRNVQFETCSEKSRSRVVRKVREV